MGVARSQNLIKLTVREPGGRSFVQVLDGLMSAAEAVEAIVRTRNLPRTDLLGATAFAWRIGRAGEVIGDETRMEQVGGATPVDLVRVSNRALMVDVVVRDPAGDAWITTAIGTAVPAGRIIGWLVQVFALEPAGWNLKVSGAVVPPDGVLEGRIEDGATLELTR